MEKEKTCASCVYFDEDESGGMCLLKRKPADPDKTGCQDWLKYDEGKLPF